MPTVCYKHQTPAKGNNRKKAAYHKTDVIQDQQRVLTWNAKVGPVSHEKTYVETNMENPLQHLMADKAQEALKKRKEITDNKVKSIRNCGCGI